MIVYFSATGNTKYIAELLADLLDDEITEMNAYMKKNMIMHLKSEKPYVFLSPVYLSTFPEIVMDLLNESTFEGNGNAYFIMTNAGKSGVSGSDAYARVFSEKHGLKYRGIEHLGMPQDYIMMFKIADDEDNKKRFKAATDKTGPIADKIKNNENLDENESGWAHRVLIPPTIHIYNKWCISAKKFRVTSACIHCGLCERSCPLNNIQLKDGKPVWGNHCIHCTACINRCPKQAIEYGKVTAGKNRYVAPSYKKSEE